MFYLVQIKTSGGLVKEILHTDHSDIYTIPHTYIYIYMKLKGRKTIVFKMAAVFSCVLGLNFGLMRLSRLWDLGFYEKS